MPPIKVSRTAIQSGKDSRHKPKGFGPKKSDLFALPKDYPIVRALPDMKARGLDQEEIFWFSEMGHWVTVLNEQKKDDEKSKKPQVHQERWTCFEYLKEEQPLYFADLMSSKKWDEKKARCRFCEVLTAFQGDYDSLPMDKKGFGVEFRRDISHNCQVLVPKKQYEENEKDEFPVKIWPMKSSALEAMMDLLDDYPDIIDPSVGRDVKIKLSNNSYSVMPLPKPSKLWLPNWKQKAEDLEEQSTNLHTYDEQTEYFIYRDWEHLLGEGAAPKKRKTVAKKTTRKKAVKKAPAQSRVKSARKK